MKPQAQQYNILIKALLPAEVFDYFEIVNVDLDNSVIDVHLDELNLPPDDYSRDQLSSKGFHEATVFQDFPIRDKAVYLHVRRRKWLVKDNGKIISRQWDLSAKGSRYTKDFATFLKGLHGYLPNKWKKP